jgi:hypothetical protein
MRVRHQEPDRRSRAVFRSVFVVAIAAGLAGCGLFAGKEVEKPKKRGPDLGPPATAQLSAGNGHSCGVHGGSGSLYCWGRSADEAPKAAFRRVANGFEHVCAIRAEDPRKGEIECWGRNDEGQAKPPKGVFIELAAGYDHSCALQPGGKAVCWGQNAQGQAKPPDTRFTQLSAGKGFTCGITRTKSIECWGRSDKNQTDASAIGSFVQLGSGPMHSCAVADDGQLSCWGDDSAGKLKVPEGKYRAVAGGLEHTCALRDDGKLACWGADSEGQVKAPEGEFIALTAGWLHTCAITSGGDVECWGKDYYGESQPHAQFQHVGVGKLQPARSKADSEPVASDRGKSELARAGAAKPDVPGAQSTAKGGKPQATGAADAEPAADGKDKRGKVIAAADAAPSRKDKPSGADMAFDLEEVEAGPVAESKADAAKRKAEEARAAREEEKKKKPKSLDYFMK